MPKSLIPDGIISRAVREGLALRAKLLKSGKSVLEVDGAVGQVLKRAWQFSRGSLQERSWRYVCERCKDTGWMAADPTPEAFARLIRLYGPNPTPQEYVIVCEPCRWRTQEREKRRKQLNEDDVNGVGAAGRRRRRS